MHISIFLKTIGSTARLLNSANLDDDIYHQNIQNTANQLVLLKKGDYTYVTQYTSGSCVWQPPTKTVTLIPVRIKMRYEGGILVKNE